MHSTCPTYRVSVMMMPSSTQAMLVLAAPKLTTQAVDAPAPYVAAKDSLVDVSWKYEGG